jgi:uncharacterized protein
MKDLVEYIVKQLVNNPDQVVVTEEQTEEGTLLTLDVAPEDMGVIIGKGGQTIKSIRKLLTVKAIADQVRVNLRLNEVGEVADKENAAEEESTDEKSATEEIASEAAPEEITEEVKD